MSNPDLPDRWSVTLNGRTNSDYDFDPVSLIVTDREETAGLELEEVTIIRLCGRPTAVVEIAAHLNLPLGVVKVLLSGLKDQRRITARHPKTSLTTRSGPTREMPDADTLREVLHGLRNL